MKNKLNLAYTAVLGFYWMFFAIIINFSSVFLLSKGYTNTEIGTTLAFVNIFAVLIQPIISDFSDRSKRFTLTQIASMASSILLVLTILLIIPKFGTFFLSIIYIATGGLMLSLQPILNAIAFRYSTTKSPISYGIARSFGSVLYSILIISLGSLIASYGSSAVPMVGVIVLVFLLAALAATESIYRSNLKSQSFVLNRVLSSTIYKKTSMITFLSGKKILIIFSLGTLLIFFQNAVLNNYLYQIVKPIGGTELDMGRIFSFMAIMEIPGLLLFNKIKKRVKYQTLIKLSSIAFIFKIMLTYLATSVSFIFIAFLFQLFSFPIYIAASIHLMNEVLPKNETVKGQSLVTIMLPFSAIFANVVGGIILDTRGPSTLLLISTILCIAGSIVIISIIDKIQVISE